MDNMTKSTKDMSDNRDQGKTASRRDALKRIGAIAAAPLIGVASRTSFAATSSAGGTLRVSTFGGDFLESYKRHFFPVFTQQTGIKVEPVEQPEGAQFMLQLAQANQSGRVPMDVCMVVGPQMIRGRGKNIWRQFSANSLPATTSMDPHYVGHGASGIDGVAAMGWYFTLAYNPKEIATLPDTWGTLWENRRNTWGLESGGQSPLFEIAAAMYFGGTDILNTRPGIDKVIAKIAELKPNVKLWWQDEGTMQTALQNGEVAGGAFIHDVAISLRKAGFPIRSVFPREGGLQGVNYWCQPSASKKLDEAAAFINFSCSPLGQEIVARDINAAPVIERNLLKLTDDEFNLVSSVRKPIFMATEARVANGPYMTQAFNQMLMG
jgi:putative spermidine/putrescine transport system substrate-binding protein